VRRHYEDIIVGMSARLVVPFIQIYALYVIFHGHYSPGGGFQGGALLAASFLLMRLAIGTEVSQYHFHRSWGTRGSSLGALIFLSTGLLALLLGSHYLDYAALWPWGGATADVRSYGILIIEVGVALAVACTLVAIFDDLVGDEEEPDEEIETGRHVLRESSDA
jgi:multicomponent Na+:H+ antiporter subunit B